MFRDDSGNGYFYRRIPADIVPLARGLKLSLPVGEEFVSVTLSPKATHVKRSLRSSDPREVKARTARLEAHLEEVWARLREDRPATLTHKQAVALAGELYREWAAGEGRERTLSVTLDRVTRKPIPDALDESADIGPAHWAASRESLERLKLQDVEYREGVAPGRRPLEVAFGGAVDALLSRRAITHLDPVSRQVVLEAFRQALIDAFAARERNASGDYAPDPKAARFPTVQKSFAVARPEPSTARPKVSLKRLFEDWQAEAKTAGSSRSKPRRNSSKAVEEPALPEPPRSSPDCALSATIGSARLAKTTSTARYPKASIAHARSRANHACRRYESSRRPLRLRRPGPALRGLIQNGNCARRLSLCKEFPRVSDLRLVLEPPFARLVLNRPERRNAMSGEMWRALESHCSELESAAGIGAVIVEGTGGHFCSGADISEFDKVFADLECARSYLGMIERALGALSRLKHPTLAKIEGSAVGGGLAIALACDMRIASEDAHIAVPPAKLGLLYGPMETRLLVETVGPAIAKDLLFSGRSVASREALELGLINRLTRASELADAVETQGRLWSELSRSSIRGAKTAVRAALDANFSELRSLVEAAAMSADFREGRTAFKEKRRPDFTREV
jgi:enoyl-CoA hydratase/carnithine racemase